MNRDLFEKKLDANEKVWRSLEYLETECNDVLMRIEHIRYLKRSVFSTQEELLSNLEQLSNVNLSTELKASLDEYKNVR